MPPISRIYLDHNATSPMPEKVRRAVAEAAYGLSGNPSSPHQEGRAARRALEELREELSGLLGFAPEEVILTSGGTESNNLALRGLASARRAASGRARIITSLVEHPSVLETCRALESEGDEVVYLGVDRDGRVDPGALDRALAGSGDEIVSIMHANNETGVIQPLEELAILAAERGAHFHCDMVQTAGRLTPAGGAVSGAAGVTACTIASHKMGGPSGIGALAVRKRAGFRPQITGGPQEGRRRAGTEPALLAAGFAAAIRLARDGVGTRLGLAALRDRLEAAILEAAPGAAIHGAGAPRLPNTTSFHIPGAPGRYLVMQLDLMGIAVSTGSACSSGSARPSHVLQAMGCSPMEARDSVRLSLGPGNTPDEIERTIGSLREAIGMAGESGRRMFERETTRSR